MNTTATYFDGETARSRTVTLRLVGDAIEFLGEDTPHTVWSIKGMHVIDTPAPGQPFRITHATKPGARIVIADEAFIASLKSKGPHLKGGYGLRHVGLVLGWSAFGLVLFAALGYLAFSVLPEKVAHLLPDTWRNRTGEQLVRSITDGARRCETAGGKEAIAGMIAALAEGRPDLPPIAVEVYDIPVLNAFAVSGGRIIVTSQLIKEASTPEEVTGVLAHEIGHVAYLHPEAQMLRLASLDVLSSVFSGGGNGSVLSSVAGLATILQYSQEAERQADAYARDTLQAAAIDPIGLKTFFEKILKLEQDAGKKESTSKSLKALETLGSILSTHPGTEERIKGIQPLPSSIKPIQVLTSSQWNDFKNICKS